MSGIMLKFFRDLATAKSPGEIRQAATRMADEIDMDEAERRRKRQTRILVDMFKYDPDPIITIGVQRQSTFSELSDDYIDGFVTAMREFPPQARHKNDHRG